MIVGVGMDLTDMRRIERAIERFGERFLHRVFTDTERARAERRSGEARIGTYAKRWAAKEACAKALGTGFATGVYHSTIGVDNLRSGQPTLTLTGGAATRLAVMTPANMVVRIHLTMTDDVPYALAQVMIEALLV
ncbi:holo-ACP synthase [Acetobacter oeni]|uniref:Holo-[acyl-carrier-protein] synthase n=1 Tax=Acetobacter oeni TaxID=304077 RepID=A0A511XGB5_9PROT|nr:holo-ACP synthase [Acetobacter oeni]MBB3882090.1 holo-[acyl-carrier protein] synthase [Acetobacter oeni]NHO17855.1 holo-ACP synthase [Acetobacter oeni]GBR03343.1 holo-ACP synthase [Acetobacter oeni LMG 21952]GEN61985.1 holo-[acyl-carrier-protein] synthase [Acetobacter oeni]